jgi:hypothetical protein
VSPMLFIKAGGGNLLMLPPGAKASALPMVEMVRYLSCAYE